MIRITPTCNASNNDKILIALLSLIVNGAIYIGLGIWIVSLLSKHTVTAFGWALGIIFLIVWNWVAMLMSAVEQP